MLKKILEIKDIKALNQNEKKAIKASSASRSNCAVAISLDCTLCLCVGWKPQGCVCVPVNP